jgi:toxin-antitoxin system PIN domain toxin
MLCVDVNVLVTALRSDAAQHGAAHDWLDAAQSGDEPACVLTEVAAATVRVLTNPRIWATPSRGEDVLAAIDDLCAGPAFSLVDAPPSRWPRFASLVTSMGLRGNDIPDALLAASSLEMDAVLVTFDRGFLRFPELRVELV